MASPVHAAKGTDSRVEQVLLDTWCDNGERLEEQLTTQTLDRKTQCFDCSTSVLSKFELACYYPTRERLWLLGSTLLQCGEMKNIIRTWMRAPVLSLCRFVSVCVCLCFVCSSLSFCLVLSAIVCHCVRVCLRFSASVSVSDDTLICGWDVAHFSSDKKSAAM